MRMVSTFGLFHEEGPLTTHKQVMRKDMTETIYTTGERHPQSTKPMKKGKPLSSGKYATRAELEEVVLGPAQPRV